MWVRKIVRRWRNGSKRNRISDRGIAGGILPAILLVIFLVAAISDSSENRYREESEKNEKDDTKGYDLPVDEREREEAWNDCIRMMQQYLPGGNGSGMSYSKEDMLKMQKKAARAGLPVTTSIPYSNMENYESAEQFLMDCMDGKKGNIVIYEIDQDGGLVRNKYVFDGSTMYLLAASGRWDENGNAGMPYISYTRIDEWKYTEKGWFGYVLCVPEPPQVSEIVDGSYLVRIRPMTDRLRELSEQCVFGVGYQGNNLLSSDWDENHMEDLKYDGMFESLYEMKYQETYGSEEVSGGIPETVFESLLKEYLPVTAEQLREYAKYDEVSRTYARRRLGNLRADSDFLGTSLPEVTRVRENSDGTMTLTVDAVCDMVVCEDAMISSELTVRFSEDGSFRYLGNRVR